MPRTTTLPKSEIVARYTKGESVEQLAGAYGISYSAMRGNLLRWGATLRQGRTNHRWTAEERREWVQRYEAGESIEQLARVAGVIFATMRVNLHRWGATVRRQGGLRQYAVDETFFDAIDTEEKAYWLGFAITDGSLRRTKKSSWVFRIALQKRDEEHLRKFLKAVNSDTPVKPSRRRGKEYPRITITSVKLCQSLIHLGCTPNKTCNHGTPRIPERLQRHFWRGAVDGDGGFSHNRSGWDFGLTGAKQFVADFQAWLVPRAKVNRTKLQPDGRAFTAKWRGGCQLERIARLLYDEVSVAMDRKVALCRELLARPNKRRRKLPTI